MPNHFELEAAGEPRSGDTILFDTDRTGVFLRSQYAPFFCNKCRTHDEPACLRAGLPPDYRPRRSNVDVYLTGDHLMVWSRRFAALMRRHAGDYFECFSFPTTRDYVVPWPKRVIEPPDNMVVRRSRDWRTYPHPFQVRPKPCPGCGRRLYTFHSEHFVVPKDVVLAAVVVNSGDRFRHWAWIVAKGLAERIRSEDFRGVALRDNFKTDPNQPADEPRPRPGKSNMPPRPTARKRRTPASPTPIPIDRANAFGRLTEQSLRRFEEKQLGARLPADYRRWLLRHNGGLPRPPSLSGEAGDVMDYPVRLFPLHDRPYSDDTPEGSLGFPLHAALKNLRREPPDDQALLPMGADWWGNYYCLALRGGRRGRVFLLDHETGSLADEAESFSDFLSNLE